MDLIKKFCEWYLNRFYKNDETLSFSENDSDHEYPVEIKQHIPKKLKTLCEENCGRFHKKEGHPLTPCSICQKELTLTKDIFCKYCGKWYCARHRLPEKHHCSNPRKPKDLIQPEPHWRKGN